jgi:ABC-type transport system involved in multi-copper enzyme maturation permease subunit
MTAVPTIVLLTLYEARRRKILTAALLGGLAFLVVFSVGISFAEAELTRDRTPLLERQAILSMLTTAGLYATNFLSVLLAVLLPVDALSGEIDSGVMQTVASKPIRRAEIVIGKWLGHGIIVAAYVTLLSVGVLLAGRIAAGHVQLHAAQGLALMMLELALLLSVSIAGGTRLSTVANGIMALGFYGLALIGGWVEQIGGLAGIQSARTFGIAVSLVSPPDALWRMAMYHMQPQVVRDAIAVPVPFAQTSVPNLLMVWWAAGFMIVTLAWALRSFDRRSL